MKLALLAFSPLSRLACRTKDVLYKRGLLKARKAPLPTVSVGNLSFGGTEKTPLAMELIAHLVRMGHRPAFVSRGYRGSWERNGGILSDGAALLGTWEDGGDEPFMVARRFPKAGVFVGKDRLASCLKAREWASRPSSWTTLSSTGASPGTWTSSWSTMPSVGPSAKAPRRSPGRMSSSSLERRHSRILLCGSGCLFPKAAAFELQGCPEGIYRARREWRRASPRLPQGPARVRVLRHRGASALPVHPSGSSERTSPARWSFPTITSTAGVLEEDQATPSAHPRPGFSSRRRRISGSSDITAIPERNSRIAASSTRDFAGPARPVPPDRARYRPRLL